MEKLKKFTNVSLNTATGALIVISLLLTFTVSDYYIFNRIGEFNVYFVMAQWLKKAGLLMLPLAVFYKKRTFADCAKYILPVAVIVSTCTFGKFFDVTAITEDSTSADLVYAHINEFMPKWLNMTLFFLSCALYLYICAFLFVRDGFKADIYCLLPLCVAIFACAPLNVFENFFDINDIPADSFLRFKNFTLWHFLAIVAVTGVTVGAYFLLRKRDKKAQEEFLIGAAIVLLIQYHSKDSIIMGDGYNVYHTIFACIPLFICNLGVYVASASVIFKKKILYAISFFVHAAGAVSVFVYFGRDDMSNYGIFCSYSILYFCLTHCLLFALSVLPSALGHYKFKPKNALIPLSYYFTVIVVASVASALVTSASTEFSYGDYTLQDGEWLFPNYAFTQINPLPFELPIVALRIWKYDLNVLYVLGLYAAYVAIFYAFNGAYYAYLAVRGAILKRTQRPLPLSAEAEAAATDGELERITENEKKDA